MLSTRKYNPASAEFQSAQEKYLSAFRIFEAIRHAAEVQIEEHAKEEHQKIDDRKRQALENAEQEMLISLAPFKKEFSEVNGEQYKIPRIRNDEFYRGKTVCPSCDGRGSEWHYIGSRLEELEGTNENVVCAKCKGVGWIKIKDYSK